MVLMLWQYSRKEEEKCVEQMGEARIYQLEVLRLHGCITSFYWKIFLCSQSLKGELLTFYFQSKHFDSIFTKTLESLTLAVVYHLLSKS